MATSEPFRKALSRDNGEQALKKVNEALEVERKDQIPKDASADVPLLLLERATILQNLGDYEASSRDYQFADRSLDVIDLTNDTAGDIAKYMYSDDATTYRSPPHEKLLINTMNMINYLSIGNANGAKIEARRMVINRKYLEGQEEDDDFSMMAMSSYLAGVSFEMAGDYDVAMRHYADARDAGSIPGLDNTVVSLSKRTGASDIRLKDMLAKSASVSAQPNQPSAVEGSTANAATSSMTTIASALQSRNGATAKMPVTSANVQSQPPTTDPNPEADKTPGGEPADVLESGDVIVIVQGGMAPYKIAKRIPIGAAIVYASAPGPGARLSPAEQRRANAFAAKGILKWINYPALKQSALPTPRISASIAGSRMEGGLALDVSRSVFEEFKRNEGTIIASAITRLITRAVAGEATQAITQRATKSGAAGFLLGLLVEGALTAADTPDTRSWTTLPGSFHVFRMRLPAGRHALSLDLGNRTRKVIVDVPAGKIKVMNFSAYR